MRNFDISMEKMGIDKHRYRELRSFCLQYPRWRDELKYKTDTLKSPSLEGLPRAGGITDQTGELAARRMELQRKCDMVDRAAKKAAGDLAEYLIENVTHEDKGFNYLQGTMGMPMGPAQFYRCRRKFYVMLNKDHRVG